MPGPSTSRPVNGRVARGPGAHSASGGHGQPAHPEARDQPSQPGATRVATQPAASEAAVLATPCAHATPAHSDQQLCPTPGTSPSEPALSVLARSVNPAESARAARACVVQARTVIATTGARLATVGARIASAATVTTARRQATRVHSAPAATAETATDNSPTSGAVSVRVSTIA